MKHTLTRIEELLDNLRTIKDRLREIYANDGEPLSQLEDRIEDKRDSLMGLANYIAGGKAYLGHNKFLHLPSKSIYTLCSVPISQSGSMAEWYYILICLDNNTAFGMPTSLNRSVSNLADENDLIALFGATMEFNWELA
jgi:hypothetical protein